MSDAEVVSSDAVASEVVLRGLDGLRLAGTFTRASGPCDGTAVLVHGGGVTRSEGGFFDRLADGLAETGVSSLRFDLRGHGESGGRQQELTLSSLVNDIRAAVEYASRVGGGTTVHLYGTSFGGGVSACFAARFPECVRSLILANPLLDYKKRVVDDKPYWTNDHIAEEAGRELADNGFIPHSPSFKLGRALLNEVFHLEPLKTLSDVRAPTLFIHGTHDTFIPVESSRRAVGVLGGEAELIEIDGAQHGFAVHDDPQYRDPRTREWQDRVISSAADWMRAHQ